MAHSFYNGGPHGGGGHPPGGSGGGIHPNSAPTSMRMGITTYYRTMSIDNKITTIIIGPNGEPIKLPESLESLPKSDQFPGQRHRWNTNEEIASMLIAFDRHIEWLSKEVKIRPKSGSMLLYSRKKVRYRRDGYCWKKRKDGKTTREDHMKLKVQGMECIYGCYVHSAILPTFHRRCYWLLQNPDIVLVHYLNVPYPDDNKLIVSSNVSLWGEKKEWTKDELISQLKPMFFSEEEPDLNNELEISTAETVNSIVNQLMEKQRAARAESLSKKQTECSCPDSTNPDKPCPHYCGGAGSNKTGGHPTDAAAQASGSPRRSRSGRNNNNMNSHHHRTTNMNHLGNTGPPPVPPQSLKANPGNQPNANQYYKTTTPAESAYYASYGHVSSTSDFEHHQHQHRKQQQQQQQQHHQQSPGLKDKKGGGHVGQQQSSSSTSPVASAVRTLSHLSDFGGLNGCVGGGAEGGYEPYFMNAESLLPDCVIKSEKVVVPPLMDFKSAFSDLENSHKSSELSFNDALDFETSGSLAQQTSNSAPPHNHLPSLEGPPGLPPYLPLKDTLDFKNNQSGSSSVSSASSTSNQHFPPDQQSSHTPFDTLGIDSFDILKDFSDFASYSPSSSSGAPLQQHHGELNNHAHNTLLHPGINTHPSQQGLKVGGGGFGPAAECCFNWNNNNASARSNRQQQKMMMICGRNNGESCIVRALGNALWKYMLI